MNRRQKIVLSVTGIFLVALILIGLTYAYFLTQITGNTNPTSISVETANLALKYDDGNGILTSDTKLVPDTVVSEKTFSVENTGDTTIDSYGVTLEDLKITNATDNTITTLEYPDDFRLTITCTSSDTTKECDGYNAEMPSTNDVLFVNSIDEDEIHYYTLKLEYVESGIDQSKDMNKKIEAKVDIINIEGTADIKGTLTNYEAGDYVQINSEPKKAYVDKDGKYKLIGVEAGTHTLGIYNTSNPTSAKSSTTINIEKGNSASVNNNTVTVDNLNRVIAVDIDASAKTYDISSTVDAISAVYLVNVGDYVEYTYTPGTYTVLASETGANADQTFESAAGKRSAISAWRVLSTKNGIVTLISEKPTLQNLVLDGTKGYLNGPDILNEMTEELYSSETGTARSINLEDIKVIV